MENLYTESAFLPRVVSQEVWKEKILPYFDKNIAEAFFKAKNIEKYRYLDIFEAKNGIAFEKDPHFLEFVYDKVLENIQKIDGKVHFEIAYTFCFDESFVTNSENTICYGELKVGKETILYYFLIEYKDLIDFLKNNRH